MKKTADVPLSEKYVDAADGFRALFVFFIGWFHIWQQSWLNPNLVIGKFRLDIYPLVRTGYMWVDCMLLLSGFLTFLPYARAMYDRSALPDWKRFYMKRIARIVPSYLFCILTILFFDALPGGMYASNAELWRDLLPHLTFTHNLFPYSYFNTHLNVVLWTLGVEMQFYLLFPLIARCFTRRPVPIFCIMTGISFAYCYWVQQAIPSNAFYINQLPAFLGIYALGFAGAWMYVGLCRSIRPNAALRTLMTLGAAAILVGLWQLVLRQHYISDYESLRVMQMRNRFSLGLLTMLLILCVSWSFPAVRCCFSNRLMKFLSGISFQFYIWHQYLAVLLRRIGIPYSASDLPNQDGDLLWQWKYTLLAFALALAAATLVTYLIEKPAQRWLLTGSPLPKHNASAKSRRKEG